MAEIHVVLTSPSGHGLAKVDNPGVNVPLPSAGKAMTTISPASGTGKNSVHGTTVGVVFDN